MKAIKLKHNKNLRDIGGKYKDVEIRYNMFLRGRALTRLSPKQMEILTNKYHLRTIIDLRDEAEQKEAMDLEIPGVKRYSMPIFSDEKAGITHEDRKNPDKIKILLKLPPMEELYYDMFHGESLENLGKIIRFMMNASEDEYSVYFHCSEGKDRTGIISAILLSILGVSREEIVKEYLYTNKVAKHRARKFYFLAKYGRFDVDLARKLHGMFSAKREYIEVLFFVMDKEYFGPNDFYERGLKLNQEEIEKFREKAIVK